MSIGGLENIEGGRVLWAGNITYWWKKGCGGNVLMKDSPSLILTPTLLNTIALLSN